MTRILTNNSDNNKGKMEKRSFLFDLDGVIFDTESQYTVFWDRIGKEYLSEESFGSRIKGLTLLEIFRRHFKDDPAATDSIRSRLDRFESEMDYAYIPGADAFLDEIHRSGQPMAIFTNSNKVKMTNVYRAHPEILRMFKRIFTGEDFPRPKPAPDCYLAGMAFFGTAPEDTFIFEDSFNGLMAARDSGGHVTALATTNPHEAVAPYAGLVIDDFRGFGLEKLYDAFYGRK